MTRIFAMISFAVMLGLLGGLWFMATREPADQFAQCRTGMSVAGGTGAIGGPFELVSETGETVTDAQVLDRPSLLYFGYTFCPDVCPLDAARNAQAVDILAERGIDLQPVFISIDPERDTPEVLEEYTGYMHEDMVGLTGSAAQVKAASQAYKTYYARGAGEGDTYLMDHSVFSYLVLPGHGTVEIYGGAPGGPGSGVEAEALAESAACFIEAAS